MSTPLEAFTRSSYKENIRRLANRIDILKEKDSRKLHQFQSISLLNVEGKIFFAVITKRMTMFMINNWYVNTSIQNAGIPGFPGCIEHTIK